MKTELGRITHIKLGYGGYQDAMFGLDITFQGKGWGVATFIPAGWKDAYKPEGDHHKWTEEDRTILRAELCKKIDIILDSAKVNDINKLVGIPVEVIFENQTLKDWRVLEEVL
jgi:hypothetical protein